MTNVSSMPKLIKAFGVVVLTGMALVVGKGIGMVAGRTISEQVLPQTSGPTTIQAAMEMGLSKAAESIRSQAPIKVDQITTVVGAMSTPREIVYLMTLDAALSEAQIAATKSVLERSNAKQACENDKTRKLIALGGTMTWQYTEKRGEVFRVSVSHCPDV